MKKIYGSRYQSLHLSPKPETRNPKPETRNPHDVHVQYSTVRSSGLPLLTKSVSPVYHTR